ncbi:MAG: DedA family protein [Thermodesulfobacteriota bacterium]
MTSNKFDTSIAFLLTMNPHSVYLLLFGVLLLCGFGVPIPEDIALITGGFLAYEGLLNVHIMAVIGFCGVLIGDISMFLLGARYGNRLLRAKFFRRIITERKVREAGKYLQKYGNKIFFIARFLPGLRAPIFFTGGSLNVEFRLFLIYDALAALISVPVWVYSAWHWGQYIHEVIKIVKNSQTIIFLLVLGWVLLILLRYYLRNRADKQKTPS